MASGTSKSKGFEIHSEIQKLIAETAALNQDSTKLSREHFWYPVAISVGLITVVVTVTALILRLLQ